MPRRQESRTNDLPPRHRVLIEYAPHMPAILWAILFNTVLLVTVLKHGPLPDGTWRMIHALIMPP